MSKLVKLLIIAIFALAMVACEQTEPDGKSGTESNPGNRVDSVENDVDPDLEISCKPLSHSLVGLDEKIYGESIHRNIAVPADGTFFIFMPTPDFAKHTIVESISYTDPEVIGSCTAFYFRTFEEKQQGSGYEAGKVLVSNEWCHIAYGDDASIHDLEIEIKPNDTGKKRTLDIALICDNDYYRTMELHVIQEPLQK